MSRTYRRKNIKSTYNRSYDTYGRKTSFYARQPTVEWRGRFMKSSGVEMDDPEWIKLHEKRWHTDCGRHGWTRKSDNTLRTWWRRSVEKAHRKLSNQQLAVWHEETELILEDDPFKSSNRWAFVYE